MKSIDISLWFKVWSHQTAIIMLMHWYVESNDTFLYMIFNCNLHCCWQWKEVKPEQLMDSKLRCVFDIPEDKKAPSTPGTKNAAGKYTNKSKTTIDHSELINFILHS